MDHQKEEEEIGGGQQSGSRPLKNIAGNPSYGRHRQELAEEEFATSEHTK